VCFREGLGESQSSFDQVKQEQEMFYQVKGKGQNGETSYFEHKFNSYSNLVNADQKRQQLVEWLEPVQYNKRHETSRRLRHSETCTWILEEDNFIQWRSQTGFLWLHGIRKYTLIMIPTIYGL